MLMLRSSRLCFKNVVPTCLVANLLAVCWFFQIKVKTFGGVMRTFALLSVRARGHKAANKERWLGFEERQRSFAPSCSRLYCRQGYYSKNELKKRFLPNDLRNWIWLQWEKWNSGHESKNCRTRSPPIVFYCSSILIAGQFWKQSKAKHATAGCSY